MKTTINAHVFLKDQSRSWDFTEIDDDYEEDEEEEELTTQTIAPLVTFSPPHGERITSNEIRGFIYSFIYNKHFRYQD